MRGSGTDPATRQHDPCRLTAPVLLLYCESHFLQPLFRAPTAAGKALLPFNGPATHSFSRTPPQLNAVDAVDIFLVALLVYEGLLVMRQTRATSLIKGVGVVLVAVLITTWFPTFNWLVSRLILPGTVALIVIFQPELRMALERLGRGGWFSSMLDRVSMDDRQWVISEVVDVAEQFSERRIGALIVLQRLSSLMDITRTGKTINGRVSAELLATIFEPHSPYTMAPSSFAAMCW